MRFTFCCLLTLSFVFVMGQETPKTDTIISSKAAILIGQKVIVRAKVATTYFGPKLIGQPNYLNLDKPFPDNPMVVIIYNNDLKKLKLNLSDYKGKTIVVKGKMEEIDYEYGKKPCIKIMNKEQIAILK
jgi:hypothetical protein